MISLLGYNQSSKVSNSSFNFSMDSIYSFLLYHFTCYAHIKKDFYTCALLLLLNPFYGKKPVQNLIAQTTKNV